MTKKANGTDRGRPFNTPTYRPLKVYAFDPTRGQTLGNHMTMEVPYEHLDLGPIGDYLEVIDYDATSKCYYLPVDLEESSVMINGGLQPSESNPQFHQQMVYAVASQTIAHFELALGRRIRWRAKWKRGRPQGGSRWPRLRIFPHAMQAANAFFSKDLGALVFGYFPAVGTDAGRNLPNQRVFTCLSHDIIAHETTHALLDDQRDFFDEPSSEDTIAFHEAFADIVALFQHFMFREPLREMIRLTGGEIFRRTLDPEIAPDAGGPLFHAHLSQDNPLVDLAVQFGEAMGMRRALRSALGSPPNSNDIEKYHEPHMRGSVLVAAVFDAFFTVYVRRTSDLIRIAHASGMAGPHDSLHQDIVNRLADTASKTAKDFLRICVRALDYCPAVDIRFGDFLRALVTADFDLYHDDKYGYRAALIDAFRSRGIFPAGAISYSEEALLWDVPEPDKSGNSLRCEGLTFRTSSEELRKRIDLYHKNAEKLHKFAKRYSEILGLAKTLDGRALTIYVKSIHEMHRMTGSGRLLHNFVAGFYQRTDMPFDLNDQKSPTFPFRGGTIVIFDEAGFVKYIIRKRIDSKDRLEEEREYLKTRQSEMSLAPYSDDSTKIFQRVFEADFGLTHRGY